MELLNTLYVLTPDSRLRLDNDTIRVEQGEETRLRVPVHHIESVVCFGHVVVSVPLMQRLPEEGIALVFLDANGRFKARLEGPISGNVLLRIAQQRCAADIEFALDMGRRLVAGKIRNQRLVVLRGIRDASGDEDVVQLKAVETALASAIRSLPQAPDLDTVRGIEGAAAREYFRGMNFLVRRDLREKFAMKARTRRPPRDRMNAALSFVYSMWTNDCRSCCEIVGLDPQIGYLHAVRPGRAALALDLLEEFRPFADRLVLSMVNRAQLGERDFDVRDGGAVQMTEDGRRKVVLAFQERKRGEVAHPLLSEPLPLGLVPLVQARLMARTIRHETPGYVPFTTK